MRSERTFHLLAIAIAFLWGSGSAVSAEPRPTEDVLAVLQLSQSDMDLQVAIIEAKTNDEKERLRSKLVAMRKRLPVDLLELADKYPMTTGELAALYWASFLSSNRQISKMASQRFQQRAVSAELEQLAAAIRFGRQGSNEAGGSREIARVLLNRAKENHAHEKSAELLTCICRLTNTGSAEQPLDPVYSEAADLIASRYPDSSDIVNFCKSVGNGARGSRWALHSERRLKMILNANQHRHVRCAASFALATLAERAAEDRQQEAIQLYRSFFDSFDGEHEYHYQVVERFYRDRAAQALATLEFIGKPCLETTGGDLEEKQISLPDYKGKVVLLSFWASWCGPCMRMIPHEREIVARYKGEAFALLGVNGDPDITTAKSAAEAHGVTWRSFRNQQVDGLKISDAWKVSVWPTLYLIDGKGIVRRVWRDEVPPEEISGAIQELVDDVMLLAD